MTSTCNSCTGFGNDISPEACNQNRINDVNGSLSFRFNGPTFGTPVITDENQSNLAVGPESEADIHFVTIPWAVLCSRTIGNENCDSQDLETVINIGVDKDGDMVLNGTEESLAMNIKILSSMEHFVNLEQQSSGIGEFEIYPGDEKVYLLNMVSFGDFPSYNGITFF